MVRRWSYINNVNSNDSKLFSRFTKIQKTYTILSYLYYRKKIWKISKFTRKTWRRRKHINNFIAMNNIMNEWSNDYNFFKKYNKFIFSFKLFKSSFLAHNLLILKNINPASCLNTEYFTSGFLNKSIFNYFINLKFTNYVFLKSVKNIHWSFISCNSEKSISLANSSPSSLIIYKTEENSLYSLNDVNYKLITFSSIINLLQQVHMSKLKEFYKILTITFFRILK